MIGDTSSAGSPPVVELALKGSKQEARDDMVTTQTAAPLTVFRQVIVSTDKIEPNRYYRSS